MTVLLGLGRNAFGLDGVVAARPHGLADEYLFRSADPAGVGPLLRGSRLSYAGDVRANMATLAVGRDKLSGCAIVTADEAGLRTDPGCPVTGTEIWEGANDMPFAEPTGGAAAPSE